MNPAAPDSYFHEKNQYNFNIGKNENIDPSTNEEEMLEDDFDFGEEDQSKSLDQLDGSIKDIVQDKFDIKTAFSSEIKDESVALETSSTAKEFYEKLSVKEENIQFAEKRAEAADLKTLNMFGIKEIKTKKDINTILNQTVMFDPKTRMFDSVKGLEIPHIRDMHRKHNIGIINLIDNELHVHKILLAHLGPTYTHFDSASGKHIQLKVVAMTNQLFKNVTQILATCYEVQQQLQELEKQKQNPNRSKTVALTPRVPLKERYNVKLEEKSKEHRKLFDSKMTVMKEKKKSPPVNARLVTNRNGRKEFEKENEHAHNINVRQIRRSETQWDEKLESMQSDFVKYINRSNSELLQDLNEVILPIQRWEATPAKVHKFEQFLENHHATRSDVEAIISGLSKMYKEIKENQGDSAKVLGLVVKRLQYFLDLSSHS